MALVEVASTFSQDSLDKVKSKLEELRVNLQQSVEDDKVNEQAALGEYEALMQELEEVRKAISVALNESETKLRQQQSALALQEKIFADAVQELKSAQDGKIAKEKQCEDWRNKWAADKEQRGKEIAVVKQVEAIIATKLETMKDYLKERAGLN
jgi:chromosome segregation ATPase